VVCEYGDKANEFYVILKGDVGIKIPTNKKFKTREYFDIFLFVVENYPKLDKIRDPHSKKMKRLVDYIGIKQVLNVMSTVTG
jgi:hypothetical protein